MKPIINSKPCSKCECSDTPKYVRKKEKNGKVRIQVSGYCILCHREDASVRNIRYFRLNKEKRVAQNMAYRDRNREQYNESQREWYLKNRERLCTAERARYVPKKRTKGYSHTRKPKKNNPFRQFDFSIAKNRKVYA